MALPPLREELALLPGATLADGQPSHTLHDPVRNLFFQIDWATFEILSRWHLGDGAAIATAVSRETALQLEPEDVEQLLLFLAENQLLQPAPESSGDFAARLEKRKGSLGSRLLHHYLFFRVPLVKPDAWLDRWAGRLDFFYSRHFFQLTLLALAWGLVEVYRQWETFASTLVDTMSWSGLASYGLALTLVKVLHELGHAVTAKRLGCRVPAMGVAFLVLWPVAYTDTNDVWKLTLRQQRLAVVSAGILAELAIAAWATLAWALLPEGGPKSLAFLLATTTWIASIAINASPFMRFDGYFLLSDWLSLPNLHSRAFALARWDLRERLFALGEPPPEHQPAGRRRWLILFAYATWIYRLVLFFGIAALVYSFFIKAVGILLFVVEILWFILLPIHRELQVWKTRWPALRQRPRARKSALAAALILVFLVLPWPTRVAGSGLLRPEAQWIVYAPPEARVTALPIHEGGRVAAGTVLLELTSDALQSRLTSATARVERLRWQATAGAFDPEQRAQWQASQEQLRAAEAELAGLQLESSRYRPAAPFPGILRDLPPDLAPGDWVENKEPLARLVSEQGQLATAYVEEEDVWRIAPGDRARFYADAPGGPVIPLEIVSIDPDASRVLADPELAAPSGGTILVREKNGQLQPERPVYRVTLKGAAPAAGSHHTWRGRVVISGRWASPGWRYLRSALALLQREAGF